MKKRNSIWLYALLLMGFVLFLTNSCKTDDNDINNRPTIITVTDIDGNVYNTITIGKQVWMKENLKVNRYRNGDFINNVTDSAAWINLTGGAYCSYDNSTTNTIIYGNLYNWYAVNDSRNIAPTGWHIPSNTEWETLIDNLGGTDVAGGALKKTGISPWADPNSGATNESDFTALPAGYRYNLDGVFYLLGKVGYWWSSTSSDINNAWFCSVVYNNIHATRFYYNKNYGCSIRCVRD